MMCETESEGAVTLEDQAISRAEAKVFFISAMALSAAVSTSAFWFGVYGTIFFEKLLYVWVAASAALLASFFVPRLDVPAVKLPWWRGRFLLGLPTVWLALSAFVDIESYRPESLASWALWLVALTSAFLTLPYLLYVIIVAVVPDIDRLTNPKLRGALLGIVALMGVVGFVIGKNHPLFLTCENFKIGGHDMPENCRRADGAAY
jgi:hypothetical protein